MNKLWKNNQGEEVFNYLDCKISSGKATHIELLFYGVLNIVDINGDHDEAIAALKKASLTNLKKEALIWLGMLYTDFYPVDDEYIDGLSEQAPDSVVYLSLSQYYFFSGDFDKGRRFLFDSCNLNLFPANILSLAKRGIALAGFSKNTLKNKYLDMVNIIEDGKDEVLLDIEECHSDLWDELILKRKITQEVFDANLEIFERYN